MNIVSTTENNTLKVVLEGRIDTDSAAELKEHLIDKICDADEIEFDFGRVEYISSAGLRVFMWLKRQKNGQHEHIVIVNMNETVKTVFELTGFTGIVTVK